MPTSGKKKSSRGTEARRLDAQVLVRMTSQDKERLVALAASQKPAQTAAGYINGLLAKQLPDYKPPPSIRRRKLAPSPKMSEIRQMVGHLGKAGGLLKLIRDNTRQPTPGVDRAQLDRVEQLLLEVRKAALSWAQAPTDDEDEPTAGDAW